MLTKLRTRIANFIGIKHTQAHPAQKSDAGNKFIPKPQLIEFMSLYGKNHWVYTAVNKLATTAASAEFMITSKPDGMEKSTDHGLLNLIGKYGKPNDDQDSFEFLEKHFQYLAIAGNSFWLWQAPNGGSPTEVHLLEPELMTVIPAADKTVLGYEYWYQGRIIKYEAKQITHFRRANPFSRYYGLSALQVMFLVVISDNEMIEWNHDFFDDELGIPSGIMVVSKETSNEDIERFRAEFTARHGERRRVAFIKADAGKAVWLDAGSKHKDYDFEKGRFLNRKAIYEALGIPLGAMSENSTEANALVAERQLANAVGIQHTRTESKLNRDGMDFWPQQKKWQAEFEDIARKALDWKTEKDRVLVEATTLSLDEMRMREHKLPPLPNGIVPVNLLKGTSNGEETREEDDDSSTETEVAESERDEP